MTTVQLKSLSAYKRLTQETPAYAAELWVNGNLAGMVSNDGHGGADRFSNVATKQERADYQLFAQAEAWAETLPPVESHGMTLPMNLEMWCHDQAYTKMGM